MSWKYILNLPFLPIETIGGTIIAPIAGWNNPLLKATQQPPITPIQETEENEVNYAMNGPTLAGMVNQAAAVQESLNNVQLNPINSISNPIESYLSSVGNDLKWLGIGILAGIILIVIALILIKI